MSDTPQKTTIALEYSKDPDRELLRTGSRTIVHPTQESTLYAMLAFVRDVDRLCMRHGLSAAVVVFALMKDGKTEESVSALTLDSPIGNLKLLTEVIPESFASAAASIEAWAKKGREEGVIEKSHPAVLGSLDEVEEGAGLKVPCSFCGKCEPDVAFVVMGPTVCVCDECVGVCNTVLSDRVRDKKLDPAKADMWSDSIREAKTELSTADTERSPAE